HLRSPPLPPPLFPYTTLFRSSLVSDRGHLADRLALYGREIHRERACSIRREAATHISQPLAQGPDALDGAARYPEDSASVLDGLDRKSTRLNSSHGSISYAVF